LLSADIVECVALDGELGYESAWVAAGHGGDQFAILAACAASTRRIKLDSSFFAEGAWLLGDGADSCDSGRNRCVGVDYSFSIRVNAHDPATETMDRCRVCFGAHRSEGDKHATQNHSSRLATDFIVRRPDRINHTCYGPKCSGDPRGFGYTGQISTEVYGRCAVRNNRDGPTGNFYVRSSHWRCWDPRGSGCCGFSHLSIAGRKDFHTGSRHEPKQQCSGTSSQ